MIKFIYEPPKKDFTSFEDPAPLRGVTMEINNDITWGEAVEQFYNFLRSAGYVIPYDFGEQYEEREWVGLTEEEENSMLMQCHMQGGSYLLLFRLVEAKLKEKNT